MLLLLMALILLLAPLAYCSMSGGPRPRAAGTGGAGATQLRPPASCDSCWQAVAAGKALAAAPTQAPTQLLVTKSTLSPDTYSCGKALYFFFAS